MCFCCQPTLQGAMFHCNMSGEQFVKLSSERRFTRGHIVLELRSSSKRASPEFLISQKFTKYVLFLFPSPYFCLFKQAMETTPEMVEVFFFWEWEMDSVDQTFIDIFTLETPTPELVRGGYYSWKFLRMNQGTRHYFFVLMMPGLNPSWVILLSVSYY